MNGPNNVMNPIAREAQRKAQGGGGRAAGGYNSGTPSGYKKPTSEEGAADAEEAEVDADTAATKTVSHQFKQSLMKARMAKKMSQKQLAFAINQAESVVKSYEAGLAIPQADIISKLNKALETTLPPAKSETKPAEGGNPQLFSLQLRGDRLENFIECAFALVSLMFMLLGLRFFSSSRRPSRASRDPLMDT